MKGRKILRTADQIAKARQMLSKTIAHDLRGKDVVLCVILKGAVYFAVDLSRDLQDAGLEHSLYFVQASSYSGKTQGQVQLDSVIEPGKFDGKHVLLVDELYDNGKTMHMVRLQLWHKAKLQPQDISTCVMFEKTKQTAYDKPKYAAMKVPDVWLVGYGLDGDSKGRGLRNLYAVCPTKGAEWTKEQWQVFVCGEQ